MPADRALTRLLGIEAPIALGAFGGLSSVELTAGVSELGGLGAYGLYGYDAARILATAAELRARTERPFALNLWLPTGDEVEPGEARLDATIEAARPIFEALGVAVPPLPARFLPDPAEQLDAVIEARPAVLSLVYGAPGPELVERCRAAGIRLMGTATTVDEAVVLERSGVDIVVASGIEAAGHRVSFLRPAEESLVGLVALVPQVVDAVSVPVLAAGGIADRRGVAAALALGASGVVVGTAFLRTTASAATEAHREAIAATPAHGSVLTRAMSGRLSRGAPNAAVQALEGADIAAFPAQNWLTGQFRAEAARQGRGEFLSLWLGQGAPLARAGELRDVFAELAAGLGG